MALALAGRALAQETREGRRDRDPEQMRQRMEQFRQQAMERMKEMMGASDEEWKVLQPRIEKVQTLSRQARGGMGFRMGGRRGGRGGDQPPEAATDREQTDVEKKMSDLQKLLQNKDSKAEDIKTALTAYRDARAAVRAELEKAQKELREILTLRQEAQLVTMGMLD
ncbi:MAG TPA: hypothetical protein DCX07_07950 [Phycisphaerales bacterium]|nr:hypothetical protein [Phycisphaerales bacterium]